MKRQTKTLTAARRMTALTQIGGLMKRRLMTILMMLAASVGLTLLGGALDARAAQVNLLGPAGSRQFGNTVIVLPNGNFIVTDPNYSIPSGAARVGAVRLYNGSTFAVISTLVGSTTDDNVGGGGVTVLATGNFVVRSPNWNNPNATRIDVGAATFCRLTTGCGGAVSFSNSLIGTVNGDFAGDDVVALRNGNYVVSSPRWRSNRGAATWGSGASGISGTISSTNSLVGVNSGDNVGNFVEALTNGNYVVGSPA